MEGPHDVRDPGGMDPLTSAIGRSIPRVDGGPKVTGRARFAADIGTRGLLHARPVLAMPAHARIERIDRDEALAAPGVVAVLVAADLPIVTDGTERVDEPLARHEILWAGQPVALVIAETAEAAADAALLVTVETTPLEAVTDLDRAVEPGAPRARFDRPDVEAGASAESQHAAVGGGSEEFTPDEPVSDNVVKRTGFRRGDVAAALAASDIVVEGRFTTSWVHQGYLEPQVAMAELDEDGALHVTAATQGTFYTRSELARLFGLRAVRRAGDRRDDRWRVRRQGAPHRTARRGSHARAPSPGTPRAHPQRGLPDDESGTRGDPRRPARGDAGWPAARPRGPPAVRDRWLRREQHRWDRGHPHHRAVSLGRPRGRRLRGRDQPGRHRRLPGTGRDAGDLRARTAHRRARRSARHRPHRAPPPQPRRTGRRDGRRDPVGRARPRRVPRPDRRASALARPRVAAGRRGGRRGRRGVAGHAAAGGRHLPARGRRTGHRRDRGGRHLGLDDRVRDDRRGGPRHRGRRGVGHHRRHRCRAALADERRERHHLLDRPGGPARHGRAARQDPGLRGPAPRDRRPGPRARRRRRPAEGHARARPDPGPDRGVARRVHLGVRAARGPRRNGPARPGAVDVRPPRPRPGRSRDRIGRGRRVRHRPGRRARPQSGHRRGPAPRRRDPGTRLGAPRGDGLRRRRAAPDRDLPRLRAPDGADGARVRDDHRRGPGTGRPVRGEGDRRGTGVRCGGGRGQRGDATRPVSASGSCR